MIMQASINCLNIIEKSEGLRLYPYLCPAKIATIGFGSTYYENGISVTLKDPSITKDRAISLMINTLANYVGAVNRMVHVPINQDQFDALVDFAYNAGVSALQTSTLLRLLNAHDYNGASGEFGKWIHAGGEVLQGLVTRRELERKLFLGIA